MWVTKSASIMRVLRFYCNYAGDTLCYSYASGSFCCNHACDCFYANYAVRSFCSTFASDGLCVEYMGTIIVFMQVEFSVAIMQVVLSAVHNYFYFKLQITVSVIAM